MHLLIAVWVRHTAITGSVAPSLPAKIVDFFVYCFSIIKNSDPSGFKFIPEGTKSTKNALGTFCRCKVCLEVRTAGNVKVT